MTVIGLLRVDSLIDSFLCLHKHSPLSLSRSLYKLWAHAFSLYSFHPPFLSSTSPALFGLFYAFFLLLAIRRPINLHVTIVFFHLLLPPRTTCSSSLTPYIYNCLAPRVSQINPKSTSHSPSATVCFIFLRRCSCSASSQFSFGISVPVTNEGLRFF